MGQPVVVSESDPSEPKEKRRFTLPSAYTILFASIVFAAIATWVIPAGVYKLDATTQSDSGEVSRGRLAPGALSGSPVWCSVCRGGIAG